MPRVDGPRDLAREASRLLADALLANLTLVVSLVVVAGVALASVVTLLMGQVALGLALGAVSLLAVAIAIEPARPGTLPDEVVARSAAATQEPLEVESAVPVLARAA